MLSTPTKMTPVVPVAEGAFVPIGSYACVGDRLANIDSRQANNHFKPDTKLPTANAPIAALPPYNPRLLNYPMSRMSTTNSKAYQKN